ncbi:LysR family transcriptional regulator [Leucothrix pacifica]|uniref:LysR family transcriptional regulator n=1 Tax=Leucothrix pacifica TaxID=1247513 RepID=A0A317CPX4_9GAMM|nr:LysR family transcriptional regulator [Leucothrix pacifica]PWR00619.1 LysR family transcriptional regulator [Leucothrix pacifica]
MNWQSVNFDWNHARAFYVTVKEGSLSAAAKALGVTQPTLSRQMAALEAELGITLFERAAGQQLVLTDSGAKLVEHVEKMTESALQFSLAASGQSQLVEGSVVISVGQLDAAFRMPKIIAELRREEPLISIEVIVTNETSDLLRREADIAIRNFHPTQNDLIAKKLGEEIIHLYGSSDYVQQLPDSLDKVDFSELQIIGFDHSTMITDLLNAQGWKLGKDNLQLLTGFQLLQLGLCKEGLGLIFFPEDMADKEPQLFRAFPQTEPVMTVPVWLVSHQELRTSPRVRRVFDFVAERVARGLQ